MLRRDLKARIDWLEEDRQRLLTELWVWKAVAAILALAVVIMLVLPPTRP